MRRGVPGGGSRPPALSLLACALTVLALASAPMTTALPPPPQPASLVALHQAGGYLRQRCGGYVTVSPDSSSFGTFPTHPLCSDGGAMAATDGCGLAADPVRFVVLCLPSWSLLDIPTGNLAPVLGGGALDRAQWGVTASDPARDVVYAAHPPRQAGAVGHLTGTNASSATLAADHALPIAPFALDHDPVSGDVVALAFVTGTLHLGRIDPTTGAVALRPALVTPTDMLWALAAYDPLLGRVYAAQNGVGVASSVILGFDMATGALASAAPVPWPVKALEFDPVLRQLVAVASVADDFHAVLVEPTTGAATPRVAMPTIDMVNWGVSAYDPATSRLYLAGDGPAGFSTVYAADLLQGTFTPSLGLSAQVSGLAVV